MAAAAEPSVAVEFSPREARALLNSSQLLLEVVGTSHDTTALDWAQLRLATALDDLRAESGDA